MQTASPQGRHKVDLATWERRAVYEFFSGFTEPYHGVCVRVDCTGSYRFAKARGFSVFLTQLHCALAAANYLDNFRTRIVDGEVWRYEKIDGGSAVGRDNGTIGFAYYPWSESIDSFVPAAMREVERVRQRNDLERHANQDLIRFSVLPWLDFTSIDHARNFAFPDSAPRITFGKITEAAGRRTMPVSIHVHHALADGLHVAQFVEEFEKRMNRLPEA